MDYSVMCMYAVTPCHAGSGAALGVVDLPIQRERHTNWPVIQSSGMKGALRANFDRYKTVKLGEQNIQDFDTLTARIFGTDKGGDAESGYAGAISVSDAKILAFPMRSSAAPFVWITCPAVLKRLNKDLTVLGKGIDPKNIEAVAKLISEEKALCIAGSLLGKVLVEDYEVELISGDSAPLKPLLEYFEGAERLLFVSDAIFDYGVSDCTQICAQIAIDQKTGTTTDGSLRYQEELPADTLMYCIIHWGDTRSRGAPLPAETIRRHVRDEVISTHIQVGGDETLGRGIFELKWKGEE